MTSGNFRTFLEKLCMIFKWFYGEFFEMQNCLISKGLNKSQYFRGKKSSGNPLNGQPFFDSLPIGFRSLIFFKQSWFPPDNLRTPAIVTSCSRRPAALQLQPSRSIWAAQVKNCRTMANGWSLATIVHRKLSCQGMEWTPKRAVLVPFPAKK